MAGTHHISEGAVIDQPLDLTSALTLTVPSTDGSISSDRPTDLSSSCQESEAMVEVAVAGVVVVMRLCLLTKKVKVVWLRGDTEDLDAATLAQVNQAVASVRLLPLDGQPMYISPDQLHADIEYDYDSHEAWLRLRNGVELIDFVRLTADEMRARRLNTTFAEVIEKRLNDRGYTTKCPD